MAARRGVEVAAEWEAAVDAGHVHDLMAAVVEAIVDAAAVYVSSQTLSEKLFPRTNNML